jgi:Leucine rich repeat
MSRLARERFDIRNCSPNYRSKIESDSICNANDFRPQESECSFIQMELKNCKFIDNKLQQYWLSELKMEVTELKFYQSNLKDIMLEAFDSDVFRGLQRLEIDNDLYNSNHELEFAFSTRGAFRGLTKLSSLIVANMPALKISDDSAMESLANTLTSLKIFRIAKQWSPSLLLRRVGLKKITTVDLNLNQFKSLNGLSFRGISEKVVTLYLTNTKLESIADDTFSDFQSLEFLYLQYNLLTTISPEVFADLFPIPKFKVDLRNNKWDCSCEFSEFKALMVDKSRNFLGDIVCSTPLHLEDLPVIEVDVCGETPDPTLTFSSADSTFTPGCGPGQGSSKKCESTESCTESE